MYPAIADLLERDWSIEVQLELTSLEGLVVLTPRRFHDERGWFSEVWNERTLSDSGIELPPLVQDNHSYSNARHTLRGLHYQRPPHAQGKLVRCSRGRIYDVAVDVRRGSSSFGRWFGLELDAETGRQLWVPPGFLHGFLTLTDDCEVQYKCTDFYSRDCDGSVLWSSAGIDWGVDKPIVSDKDARAEPLESFASPFEMSAV